MRKILKIYDDIRSAKLSKKEERIIIAQVKNKHRASIKDKAKDEFWAFCEYCLKDEMTNEYIELQDFHLEWCELVAKEKRLVLFSPVESGKSSLISVGYPIWRLGRDSNLRIAIVSNTATQASKFLNAIQEYILRDKDVKEIFPSLKPKRDQVNPNRNEKWTDYAIIVSRKTISKDFSIQALGVQGPLLSSRLNLLILDDVLDKKNTDSDSEVQKINEWHDAIAKARLVENAQEIVVGTAWKNSDLMHYLAEKPGYKTVKYSVEEEDVESGYHLARWPRRRSRKKLDEERRHNPEEYSRQRRSRTASTESLQFADIVEQFIEPEILIPDNWIRFTGVDLSASSRPGDAIVDIAVSPDLQSRIVVDIEYGQWKANIRAKHIAGHYAAHKSRIVSVEDNALQGDNLEWMVAAGYRNIPFEGFTTTGANKDAMIMNNAIELRNGLWRFKARHRFDEVCSCDWCRLIKEIKHYPEYRTSDGLMAWLFASEAARSITGKEPRIRSLDLSQSEEDNLLNTKPHFTLDDYSPNSRLASPDFVPPPNYMTIVKLIKRNKGESLDSIPYDDVEYVYEEMKRCIARLNGA
jgi:hypothetical protein